MMTGRSLRFRDDGTFTIVQFADVHYGGAAPEDALSLKLIDTVLELERPDLAVFTGDLIRRGSDARIQFAEVTSCAENAGIPYAFVFGNHDSRKDATRAELMEQERRRPYCMAEAGPESVSGVGNYTLQIGSSRAAQAPAAALYFFDTDCNAPDRERSGGRGEWIDRDKVDWYAGESARLAKLCGVPLPALAFFHIPLPEYVQLWQTRTCYGYKNAEVRCPALNVGLFAAMVKRGDVMGTFVGHDHSNDYWGELAGIRLCYGRISGFNGKVEGGLQRGARLIRLREGERGFDTWLRLADGTAVLNQPEHAPDERQVGRQANGDRR
jgi:3',5'-cyclic AMP phosphodiesterase CpdA